MTWARAHLRVCGEDLPSATCLYKDAVRSQCVVALPHPRKELRAETGMRPFVLSKLAGLAFKQFGIFKRRFYEPSFFHLLIAGKLYNP